MSLNWKERLRMILIREKAAQISAAAEKAERYDCTHSNDLAKALPEIIVDDIVFRLAAQVHVGHVSICGGCGRVLMEVLGEQEVHFPALQTLMLRDDGITMDSACGECGTVTELAR